MLFRVIMSIWHTCMLNIDFCDGISIGGGGGGGGAPATHPKITGGPSDRNYGSMVCTHDAIWKEKLQLK